MTPKMSHFEISLLIPVHVLQESLFSEKHDTRLLRFVQYYAGMLIASKEVASNRIPITFHSYDVREGTGAIEQLLKKPELQKSDVIIGPYERDDLDQVAAYGLKNDKMVISPAENPYFIQVTPGLAAHANAIMEFIKDSMSTYKVYVVTRNTSAERNRVQLFTNAGNPNVEELLIEDSTPDLVNTNLGKLMSKQRGTVFILPYYSKTDEVFVNSFMRKLHADRQPRIELPSMEAVVFGLPQWTGFTNLNPNYMESLSLHLSSSSFLDVTHPMYEVFRQKFFDEFHTTPDLHAFLGYDLLLWVAGTLAEKGTDGLIGEMDPKQYGLASGFYVQPSFKQTTVPTEMKTPFGYENRRIRILKYVAQDFVLVR